MYLLQVTLDKIVWTNALNVILFRRMKWFKIIPTTLNTLVFPFLQFTIYASYFAVIAVLFTLRGAFTAWKGRSCSQEPARVSDSGPPDPGAGLQHRL